MVKKVLILKFSLRSLTYWMMMILCIVGSITFIYKMLIDVQHVESLMELGYPLEIALYSGIIAIMCEHRPVYSPQQIKRDKAIVNQGYLCLLLITLANAILVIAAIFQQPHL